MAQEHNMTIEEFNTFVEERLEIDKEIDKRQAEEAKKGNTIVDSNLGAHFIDADLKVWLTAPLDVRAKRIFTGKY